MGTIQRQRTGTPTCSVCGHDEADALMRELTNGERVADVAARYEVSAAAIYRHQRNHAVVLAAFDIESDSSLSLVDRLVGIMDRARAASKVAYERGDLRTGALIGDAAVRAANSLQNFGVDSEKIATDIRKANDIRRQALDLSRSIEHFVATYPQQAEPLAIAAEAVGAHDLAAAFREEDSDHAPDTDEKILEKHQ
ncbi:MAG TPA: hypothetical protein DEA69_05195 [Microbacterium sp.]|nr:hypothetical protein [Microbacterium sp.]HBS08181.1 hypothetical protein [Microbacterium sp.]